MKHNFFLVFCLIPVFSFPQNLSVQSGNTDWNNYSTTYTGDIKDTIPVIVTAIPYNGTNSNFDEANTPLDMSYSGSKFRYRSELDNRTTKLYTYDSSNVYFLALGIYPNNTYKYEYEVLLNDKTVVQTWSNVDSFTNFELNDFKKGFGFLGGYKTTWNNFLRVNIRRKKSNTILASALVYWKETRPAILNIYTTNDFNDFFKKLKGEDYNSNYESDSLTLWQKNFRSGQLNSITKQPENLIYSAVENNLVFLIKGDVYKKEALEYQLIKNNSIVVDWKINDFDNNFIWLKNLKHGLYKLNIRFAKQRQNVTGCLFEIKPFWYQTIWFIVLSFLLFAGFIGFIILLIYNKTQKIKIQNNLQRKEKLNLQLKSVRSQLNPHFIFNALNSIQSLINKNEVSNANKYLDDFAKLMRETLDGSNKENNTLIKEIEILDNYLKLEQLRFNFNYSITSSLNNNEIEIPSLLVQPIVENAVKHGVSVLQEAGKILISFVNIENDVLINISDNGKGFELNTNSAGYGLKLTKDRIALINQMLTKQSIIMDIQTSNGTTVKFILKNWLA